jgi:hypothetical protein
MYERPIFDVIILVATVDVNPCQEVHSPHGDRQQGEHGGDEGQCDPQERLRPDGP